MPTLPHFIQSLKRTITDNPGLYIKQLETSPDLDRIVYNHSLMTFTFALVKKLQAAGIRCVASTTARDVVEEGGVKVSKFRFVRFRGY